MSRNNKPTPKPGEKGSQFATGTKRDGSTIIIDRNTGRVVSETNAKGQQVIRLNASTPTTRSSGGSGGGTSFSKVDDQKDIFLQEQGVKNARIQSENARIMREGNISLVGGGVGRVNVVTSDPRLMSSSANVSLASGGVGRVDYSFDNVVSSREPSRLQKIVNKVSDSRAGQVTKEFFSTSGQNLSREEKKSLSRVALVGNVFVGSTVDKSNENVFSGTPGAFQFINPAGSLGVITKIPRFLRGVTGLRTTAQVAQRAKKTDDLVKFFAVNLAVGTGITTGVKEIGLLTTNREIRQDLRSQGLSVREAERQLFKAGFESQKQAVDKQAGILAKKEEGFNIKGIGLAENINKNNFFGSAGKIGTRINPLLSSSTARQGFTQGVQQEALRLGLNPIVAQRLATRQKKFRGIGEALGILGGNVASEFAGTGFLATSKFFNPTKTRVLPLPQARKELFKTGFTQIGKAGIIEGVSTEVTTNVARNEKIVAKNLAISGALGGLSAGLLGGSIISNQAGRKARSDALYVVGALLDPFEFPSDRIAGGLRKAKIIKQEPVGFNIGKQRGKNDDVLTINNQKARSFTFNPTNTFSSVPFRSRFAVNFPSFSATMTPTSNNIFGSSFVGTFTPTNNVTFPKIKTNTNVNVNAFVPAFVPANVTVPRPVIPPPILPFGFPQGSSGRGSRKGRVNYADELSLAFGSFIGNNVKRRGTR